MLQEQQNKLFQKINNDFSRGDIVHKARSTGSSTVQSESSTRDKPSKPPMKQHIISTPPAISELSPLETMLQEVVSNDPVSSDAATSTPHGTPGPKMLYSEVTTAPAAMVKKEVNVSTRFSQLRSSPQYRRKSDSRNSRDPSR